MISRKAVSALALAAALVFAGVVNAGSPLKNPTTGTPALKSIDAIGFGPQGLLIIGDGKGRQVVAIDTGDTKAQNWTRTEILNIKDTLAAKLGTTGQGIDLGKLAVNPASQTAYVAVRAKDANKDLILTIDGTGKVAECALENVKHIAVTLPIDTKVSKITDVSWGGDRILVAAQASDTFGSKIFSIVGLSGNSTCVCFSTETFHVGHNKWETKAPIRTIIPYEENGKKFLVGTFTCTPIVKYPIEDLQPDAKVKGTSVIELGTGNTPQDMFIYEKMGKTYILMNNFRMMHAKNPVGPSPYWTAKVDYDILKETEKINEKALWRVKAKASESLTDRAIVAADYHGVTHMDRLDRERALVIQTDAKGGLSLKVLPLP